MMFKNYAFKNVIPTKSVLMYDLVLYRVVKINLQTELQMITGYLNFI